MRGNVLLLWVFAGCAHASAVTPNVPSQAEVERWSHDLLDAYDRADVAAVERALAPSFVRFEGGKPATVGQELESLRARKAVGIQSAPHVSERTWTDQFVVAGDQGAVFIGKATERVAGNDSHGGNEYVGWYKLIWVPVGGSSQLMFLGWQLEGKAAQRALWDGVFAHGTGFNTQPNALMVEVAQGLKPGAALALAMGEGRNERYLAANGWRVTGIDFSDEATRLAREQAAREKLDLDIVTADIDGYDFGVAKWDLVTMLYATDNVGWIERAKQSLKPNGVFVLEYFHKAKPSDEGFARGELAALFREGFDVLRDEVAEAKPDWAVDQATIVRFVARKH